MKNEKGFTLVEMLGVVTILVVISLFTFPMITSLMTDSNNSKNKQFLEVLYNASEIYVEMNYDNYKNQEMGYISSRRLVEEGLLQSNFTNPITKMKVLEEDGIVEVTRNTDNTFKFNYVTNEYITIYYIEDLIEILNSSSDYHNKTIVLSRNLDIKDDNSYENINALYNGTSIKTALNNGNLIPKTTSFKGIIKGNGYEISNINIAGNLDNVGLFSNLENASVENIKLKGQISGKNNVGLLAGTATNTEIKDVSVDAKFSYNSSLTSTSVGALIGSGKTLEINNVTAINDFTVNGNDVGGIVGKIDTNSTITNTKQSGFINGNENVGGIVGKSNNTTITSSTSSGKIFGITNIGGIIGNSASDTANNINTEASVSGTTNIGGIVGNSSNTSVTKTYSINEVSGTNSIGGIIGYAWGSTNISKSNSSAKINGTENIGGIVGNLSASTITDCYSLSIINADKQVGGIVGTSSSSNVSNTYYSGNLLSTSKTNIGGLIGLTSSSTLSNSYYNIDLIKTSVTGSSTNDTITDFIGKTKEEMQTASTYQNWNFTDTWKIDNDSFPNLR